MRRLFSLLVGIALVLSMATAAYAVEGMEGGEQPQVPENQSTVTVGTLEELQAAVAAADDGDTIAISAEIRLDGVTLETEKNITLVRADTYGSGVMIQMMNGAVLNGFRIEDYKFSRTVGCESLSEIKNCSFVGDLEKSDTFIFISGLFTTPIVTISDCSFSGAQNSAIIIMVKGQVTISNSTFNNNGSDTQGGAICSSGTLMLDGCTFSNNEAVSGGGVYSNGDLTITNCQFSGNSIESEKFGTDILSMGTMTITDSQTDGAGFYEESTGEKVTLPLTDYASTAKLIYLTDKDAAAYFAPPPVEGKPDDDGENETPTETPTTPDDSKEDDTADDNDNEPTIIYKTVYVPVYIEREPEPAEDPAPSLVCGDAVIDTSRSVILEGYDDGLLHLEDGLTRAQFATILYRLLDADTIEKYDSSDTVFNDVAPDSWYCRTVTTIANAGIVGGTGNGNYNPDAPLTWAHIITVLSRFVAPQECEVQNIQYDGWAADAVETAVALGWITDHAGFDPDANISRGELAYLVNAVLAMYR